MVLCTYCTCTCVPYYMYCTCICVCDSKDLNSLILNNIHQFLLWLFMHVFFHVQQGETDYGLELQQLEQEGEMSLDDLIASLPPEVLEQDTVLNSNDEDQEDKEEDNEETLVEEDKEIESDLSTKLRGRYLHVCFIHCIHICTCIQCFVTCTCDYLIYSLRPILKPA